MRTSHPTLVYTSARIVLFLFVLLILSLVGVGGLLLWALAFIISALLSYVLLSRQRDAISAALSGRVGGRRERGTGLRARLEAGARMEDEEQDQEEQLAADKDQARTS
jgi:hypothetical protein